MIAGPPESPEQVLDVELPNSNSFASSAVTERATVRLVPDVFVPAPVIPNPTAVNGAPTAICP